MDWTVVATVLSSLGLGSVLTKAVDFLVKWKTGKYEHSQDGWRAADRSHRDKQAVTEKLFETRTFCHTRHGTPYKEMPQLPPHLEPFIDTDRA